jgi:hypothetical protein
MGFETNEKKSKTYMSLGSTKSNDNKVTSKFFVVNKRNNDGQYEKLPMVETNGYPKPFYGFLTRVSPILDNMITRTDGTRVPNPKVNFEFTDDSGEIFVLDLPFMSQDKRVSTYIFGFVNSLAWLAANNRLGYIKLYISQSADKNDVKRFNLALRCAKNWKSGTKDFGIYNDESTRVDWKYNAKEIPSFEVTKVIDGETVTIDNRKKQQEFFLKEIELINEAINSATYDIGDNKSASMNKTLTSTQIFDEDGIDDVADFQTSSSPVEEPKQSKTEKTTTTKTPVVASFDDDDDEELPF